MTISIRSYADAERHFNEFHSSYRGTRWGKDEAPLASRSNYHHRLEKTPQGVFRCILYATPLVVYFPDGGVYVDYHTSNTSMRFYDTHLPRGLRLHRIHGELAFKTRNGWVLHCRKLHSGAPILRHQDGEWQFLHTPPLYIRAELRYRQLPRVERMVEDLRTWHQMHRRLGSEMNKPDLTSYQFIGNSQFTDEQVLNALEDRSRWPSVFGGLPASLLLDFVARHSGVLKFEYLREPQHIAPPPDRKWRDRLPSLVSVHGLTFA